MTYRPKILVVEDEAIVAQDIRWILEDLGYDVPAISDSGESAIASNAEYKPDLILMDVRLIGELDGISTAERILADFDVPIVYLTAHDDEATLSRAKITSPYGYIIKPFEERELRIAVEIALHKHRVESKLRYKALWFRTVLQSIGDGVMTSDAEGRVTFLNEIGELLTGWTFREAIGEDANAVFRILCGSNRQPLRDPVRQALETERIVQLPDDSFLVRKDGSEVPIDDSVAPILNPNVSTANSDAKRLLGTVVVFRDVTDKRRTERQLRYQAFHDLLTGLPNRAWFVERVAGAIQGLRDDASRQFAVLFLDLDRFKVVNDSLGHSVGDRLLVEVSQRLRSCVRDRDTVARFGGDEFGILLERVTDIEVACRTCQRIQNQLDQPFEIEGQLVFTNASIGIVMGTPHYQRVEDLVRDADIAMYRAKSLGKGRYEVFDPKMRDRAVSVLSMENNLRVAIEQGDVQPYYQPIVDLASDRPLGFEVLARWVHPERGLIPPSDFVPIAEETGLILMLDRHMLRAACREFVVWQRQNPDYDSLYISVNLSSRQFAQPTLVEQVMQTLEETGLNPRSLKLEITEGAIIENPDSAAAIIEHLNDCGVRLSVDDFGTGYSSLSYLHRFPVSTLKLDRSFVCRLHRDSDPSRGSLEIVRAILALANVLELDVIAEGIETADQKQLLAELDCTAGQGYLFAPPLPGSEALQWLTKVTKMAS